MNHTPGAEAALSQDEWTGPRPALLTLVLFAAVPPLAINLFLPSIPDIAADLGSTYATIQLGLSLFMIVMAAIQLVIGPLSDIYGRRPVIYTGFVLFLVGTTMCVSAQSATMFLAGRVIQAASAAGVVLSRAIVRDVYPREKAASAMGYMVMGMAVAPMIGPAIGGLIAELASWRMTFVALGLCGVVAIVAGLINLPETNRFRGAPLREQLASYRGLTRLPLFWLYTCVAGFSSATYFAFLGGGPAVSDIHLGLTPLTYGLYFVFTAFGYALGNFLAGRYSERRGLEKMILDGVYISLSGPLISIVLFTAGIDHATAFFLPMALVCLGNGLTLPNVMAAAVSLKPEAAGAASGLVGATQMAVGAIASVIAGFIVGQQGLPVPLCIFLTACALVAIGLAKVAIRMSARTA